jgi:hypothetical protein
LVPLTTKNSISLKKTSTTGKKQRGGTYDTIF